MTTISVETPGTGAGKRLKKTVHASTRDEALSLWKQFRADVKKGKGAVRQDETLLQYQQRYWPKAVQTLKPKTVLHETWIVTKVIVPVLGSYRLDAINDGAVGDLVGDLKASGYAAATINGVVAVLRKILRDAEARGLIGRISVRKFPHQKEERLRLELNEVERARFLAAFDDRAGFVMTITEERKEGKLVSSAHFGKPRRFGGGRRPDGAAAEYQFQCFCRSKPIFVIALETGLAQADLLGLQWSSVNLKAGWIRMLRQKTGIEATIPISTACREALSECRRRSVVGEFVFLTAAGRRYSISTVNRHFQKAKRLAGITRRFRFHDQRHTFGSRLASRGVSIQVIAKALGHSSASTAERYARPSEESLRSVREALDAERGESSSTFSVPFSVPSGLGEESKKS